jgi:hypothetical protein
VWFAGNVTKQVFSPSNRLMAGIMNHALVLVSLEGLDDYLPHSTPLTPNTNKPLYPMAFVRKNAATIFSWFQRWFWRS